MNIVDKIRENWKSILLIILALFYIGSCTSNCSHKNELRRCEIEMRMNDSIISDMLNKIDSLEYTIEKKDIIIDQKQQNVESLERTAHRNIVNVVRIDTTKNNSR